MTKCPVRKRYAACDPDRTIIKCFRRVGCKKSARPTNSVGLVKVEETRESLTWSWASDSFLSGYDFCGYGYVTFFLKWGIGIPIRYQMGAGWLYASHCPRKWKHCKCWPANAQVPFGDVKEDNVYVCLVYEISFQGLLGPLGNRLRLWYLRGSSNMRLIISFACDYSSVQLAACFSACRAWASLWELCRLWCLWDWQGACFALHCSSERGIEY